MVYGTLARAQTCSVSTTSGGYPSTQRQAVSPGSVTRRCHRVALRVEEFRWWCNDLSASSNGDKCFWALPSWGAFHGRVGSSEAPAGWKYREEATSCRLRPLLNPWWMDSPGEAANVSPAARCFEWDLYKYTPSMPPIPGAIPSRPPTPNACGKTFCKQRHAMASHYCQKE